MKKKGLKKKGAALRRKDLPLKETVKLELFCPCCKAAMGNTTKPVDLVPKDVAEKLGRRLLADKLCGDCIERLKNGQTLVFTQTRWLWMTHQQVIDGKLHADLIGKATQVPELVFDGFSCLSREELEAVIESRQSKGESLETPFREEERPSL